MAEHAPTSREVLVGVHALTEIVKAVATDAREARDGMIAIKATMLEQNVGVRIEALHAEIKATSTEIRSDMVNAITKARGEFQAGLADHDLRIDKLEQARDQSGARAGILKWLADHAPWLLAIVISGAAFLGLGQPHH
jgi:hypothetical protein